MPEGKEKLVQLYNSLADMALERIAGIKNGGCDWLDKYDIEMVRATKELFETINDYSGDY